uniref:Putative trna-binding protein n=1 Tax=Anopheles marajoara TaxID=58244 RepID=A0A2M4BTB3_9DIPT
MFSITLGSLVKRIVAIPRAFKMSDLERILANNKAAEELLESLKLELKTINEELALRKIAELKVENESLRVQVEAHRKKLIALEVAQGRVQIPVPTPEEVRAGAGPASAVVKTETAAPSSPVAAAPVKVKEEPSEAAATKPAQGAKQPNENKQPKEKKPKKEKPAGEGKQPVAAAAAVEEPPVDAGRLDMRVGRIVEVSRHPDADSLYVEKVDCGEANPRTVISGLVKFVPIEQMQNRLVVALCNLKPAKMRGILSEAMLMCASTPEKVEILAPPEGSVPGDLVHVEGFPRVPDAIMNPKKKIFETVAPDLKTNDQLVACYKQGNFVVPGKGPVKAQTLANVQVK